MPLSSSEISSRTLLSTRASDQHLSVGESRRRCIATAQSTHLTLETSRPSAHLYFPSQPPSISHLSLSTVRWQRTQFRSHNVQCCHLIGWRALPRALRKPAANLLTLADLSNNMQSRVTLPNLPVVAAARESGSRFPETVVDRHLEMLLS